jgi:three-Cys-motif partner protein
MAGDILQRPEDAGFFGEIKAAAVLKHAILRRYLHVYVAKTGTYAPGRRVVYFDGYAGPGRYDDGTDGSPLIAAGVARSVAALRSPRQLDLFLVEKDPDAVKQLRQVMAAEGKDLGVEPAIHEGDVAKYLDSLLAASQRVPLFGFIDPYGRGLPPQSLAKIMNRNRADQGRPQTELLINFSDITVRRIGGLLTTQSPQTGDETRLARLDEACGGNWWRAVYLSAGSTTAGVQAVVSGYRHRLERATSSKSWCVPVRNRGHQEPRYYLVFLSRHPDGLWEFMEALSKAAQEWREFIDREEFGEGGMLFNMEPHLEDSWEAVIASNLTRLINEGAAPFVVRDKYETVMGDTLGLAREKHIRAAVKRLHKACLTASTGKGDIDVMTILPPSR